MPYRAFRRNLTASYFAPFIIAMAMLAAIILWRFQSQVSLTNWVEHSDQVTLHVKDMEIKLREMQLAYRGYLLSRDERYLVELGDTQRVFGENLAKIAALVADNTDQEQRLLNHYGGGNPGSTRQTVCSMKRSRQSNQTVPKITKAKIAGATAA